mgnify:CR=1 FL=1
MCGVGACLCERAVERHENDDDDGDPHLTRVNLSSIPSISCALLLFLRLELSSSMVVVEGSYSCGETTILMLLPLPMLLNL